MQPINRSSLHLTGAYATLAQHLPQKAETPSTAHPAALAAAAASVPPQTMSWVERSEYHLQRKELDLALEAYTKSLQGAEEHKETQAIAHAVKGIGCIFLEKKQWAMAAKLFNGALALYQSISHSTGEQLALGKMVETERRFLQTECGITKQKILNLITAENILKNRDQLQAIRHALIQEIRKGQKPCPELFAQFSDHMALFLDQMVKPLYPILGKPPCEYALIGLGSLARREMSPYSDLEFALLLQKNSPKEAHYFRQLVKLLELEVINLGETAIKILEHGLESPTPRGFSYDDGGNTPLGKEGYVNLYGIPEEIARFQTPRFYDEDLILSNVMRTAGLLIGNRPLLDHYFNKAEEILAAPSSKPPLKVREERMLNLMKGYLAEFAPRIDRQKEENPLFNVKAELYRLPNMLITALADYYAISSGNTWSRIDLLQQQNIISSEGAKNLKKVMSDILHLRARAHLHYKGECDDVFHPSIKRKDSEIVAKMRNLFTLSDQDIQTILMIYRVLFPLNKAFENAVKEGNFQPLSSLTFYDDSLVAQGNAHKKLCQFEKAKECFEKAVRLNPDDLEALHSLSSTLNILASHQEAIVYANKGLDILSQKGGSLLSFLDFRNLLGNAWLELGEEKKALGHYEDTLRIGRKVYGEEYPGEADALHNIGKVWQKLGEAKKAVGYYEEALRIYRKVYGEEHPSVATSLNNLGLAWQKLGEEKKAMGYLEEALRIYRKVLGDEHPLVASTLNNLGMAWGVVGEAKKGMEYFEDALRIKKKVFGEEHPLVASTLNNLGLAWQKLGEEKKAIGYLEEALRTNQKVLGEEHPDVADMLNNLGIVWQKLGEAKKGVEYYKDALRIKKKVYGEEHPSVADTLNNLGLAWQKLGEAEKAVRHLEEALRIRKKVFGEEHSLVASTLKNLGLAWQKLGEEKKAMGYLEEALRINQKVLGEEHPDVADMLSNLGYTWGKLGEEKKALGYYEEALRIRKKVNGEEHPSVAETLSNLGIVWQKLGEAEKAVRHLEEALRIKRKVLGEENPCVGRGESLSGGYVEQSWYSMAEVRGSGEGGEAFGGGAEDKEEGVGRGEFLNLSASSKDSFAWLISPNPKSASPRLFNAFA